MSWNGSFSLLIDWGSHHTPEVASCTLSSSWLNFPWDWIFSTYYFDPTFAPEICPNLNHPETPWIALFLCENRILCPWRSLDIAGSPFVWSRFVLGCVLTGPVSGSPSRKAQSDCTALNLSQITGHPLDLEPVFCLWKHCELQIFDSALFDICCSPIKVDERERERCLLPLFLSLDN